MARLLALLLGTGLAALLAGAVWWIRSRPAPTHEIELSVTDARGDPVERFGWEIWDETPGAVLYSYEPEAIRVQGTARARVLFHRIGIEIRSKGLATTRIGPFEPDQLPARLAVVLPDLGVVTGVVTYAGQPVAGAEVMLLGTSLDVIEGVPSGLFYGFQDLRATTDSHGAFRIGSDSPRMRYHVRAWKLGYAAGTAGPVRVGDPPVEVQLHSGGSIEGRLILAASRDPQGIEVELYRAEASRDHEDPFERFTVRADRDGHFRFEHVDVGAWLVRLLPPEASPGEQLQRSPDFVPFVVKVAEDETTRLDLDLTQPLAQLDAQLTIHGKAWTQVWVRLHLLDEPALMVDDAEADDSGAWSLRVRHPGDYRVVMWGNHHHDTSVPREVSRVITIPPGGLRWERDIAWNRGDPTEVVLDRSR